LPHVENPLRGRLPGAGIRAAACGNAGFQWAPTLGGECYDSVYGKRNRVANPFQWAPTLGGECYRREFRDLYHSHPQFQWAPTLGGECYWLRDYIPLMGERVPFQWAPTLGGECYRHSKHSAVRATRKCGFNGHPPLGMNATNFRDGVCVHLVYAKFQWAPTLGGECYRVGWAAVFLVRGDACFNGHPPLGVNATGRRAVARRP